MKIHSFGDIDTLPKTMKCTLNITIHGDVKGGHVIIIKATSITNTILVSMRSFWGHWNITEDDEMRPTHRYSWGCKEWTCYYNKNDQYYKHDISVNA